MLNTSNGNTMLNKKVLKTGIAIFSLALVVRIIYLYEVSKSPTFYAPIIDSATYDFVAKSAVEGNIIYKKLFWQAFFYPVFLSTVYLLSGASILFAKSVQVLLGSIVCILVYRLGENMFDSRTGILAGLITALYGPLIFFEGELLATGWACFWSIVLLIILLHASENKGSFICFVWGLCAALSIITRTTFIPFAVAATIWLVLVLRRAPMPIIMIRTSRNLILLGFVLILIPVSMLSFYTRGRLSFLPESGPINFYIGNNPDTSKTVTTRLGSAWSELTHLPYQHGAKDAHQERQFFTRQVYNYITTEPLSFIAGLAHKTVQFFCPREIPRNVDMYLWRRYSRLFSLLTWKMYGFGFPFGVLLPMAIIGLVCCWRRISIPVLLFLILYPSAVILVFTSARYRLPVVPALGVLAAAGFWEITKIIKAKRWGKLSLMATAITVIVVLNSLLSPFPAEIVNYEVEMHYCIAKYYKKQGSLQQAHDHLSEAIRLDPLYADAYHFLGTLMQYQGKSEKAFEYYSKALEIKPELVLARYNSGVTLLKLKRVDQAIEHLSEALFLAERFGYIEFMPQIQMHLQLAEALLGEPNTSAPSSLHKKEP